MLRRDIKSYTDSIPTGADSPLWPKLETLIGTGTAATWGIDDRYLARLLFQCISPMYLDDKGQPARAELGTPTGSSIGPGVCNLYLADTDKQMEAIAGAFYCRYGDDILFAHPKLDVTQQASQLLDQELAALRLHVSPLKAKNIYLCSHGFHPQHDFLTGASQHVEVLGYSIDFRGQFGLKQETTQEFLTDLRTRVKLVRRHARTAEARRDLLPSMVNRVLSPTHKGGHPTFARLLSHVTDWSQLRALDFSIAHILYESITGVRGIRSFRRLSYRAIRNNLKLPSILVTRLEKFKRRRAA